jgi:hypothetical protein
MSAREQLHRLIDLLADAELPPVLRVLESLQSTRNDDPLLHALLIAAEDDEPLSSEEQTALDRALEEARRGETRPWEEVRGSLE